MTVAREVADRAPFPRLIAFAALAGAVGAIFMPMSGNGQRDGTFQRRRVQRRGVTQVGQVLMHEQIAAL